MSTTSLILNKMNNHLSPHLTPTHWT